MRRQDAGFDYDRYRRLLAEADDEPKRLALIELLVEERAREQLELQRLADRKAMTARTIATILGSSKPDLARVALTRPAAGKPVLEKPAKPT